MENNGWPARPGVPLNPEQDGWHWLQDSEGNKECVSWRERKFLGDGRGLWLFVGYEDDFQPHEIRDWTYLGPVLTPDEAAKREDVKWHEGYAVGVLDVRRGTAFGEPDTHYAALQKRVAELEAALRFYEDPFKYTDIHGDDVRVPHFYSETDFGETARVALKGKKYDVLIKKHKSKWVCPNNTPECLKNCGNYGCGN